MLVWRSLRTFGRRWWTLVLIAAWLLEVACSSATVGPFYPADPVPCRYDGDCPPHDECRFPEVDHHAICMPRPAGVSAEW